MKPSLRALPRPRRSSFALAALPLLAGAGLAAACGGVSGVDDLFSAGGTGGATSSASTGSGETSTSSGDTGTSSSGGVTSSSGGATTSSSGGATTSSSGGATTSSSGSATTSSSGSASSSSGSTMTEDCLDGVDNDGDGLVDCADPACQAGFTCVDADPPGWKGHFYVTQTALPAAAAPPCPANLTPETDFESPAGPAQCTACTCAGVQGASCAPPQISCSSNSFNCGNNPQDWTPALQNGNCDKPANLLGNAIFLSCQLKSGTTLTAPGTCAPSAVSFPNKSPWQQRIDACGTDKAGGGCGGGKVCVPKGAGAPNESLCVQHDGTMPCPAGFTKAIQGNGDATDTRACTDCTCGGPTTKCSDGSYTFFDSDACATAGQSSNPVTINSTTCADVSALIDQGSWSARATLPVPSGTCPAGGGTPTGSVQPAKPVTFCCK